MADRVAIRRQDLTDLTRRVLARNRPTLPQNERELLWACLSDILTRVRDQDPQVLPISLHHYPGVIRVSGIAINMMIMRALRERELRRSLISLEYFVVERIGSPQWEQIPNGHVQANNPHGRTYTLTLMGTEVAIPVAYLRPERHREVKTADEG
ncbi:cross-pathway control WD-repeat protein cpc2 [Pestalotiopsis sp. IQ-011]